MNKICLKNKSNEVCRMPWFLIETKSECNTPKGRSKYYIVHSVDINEAQSTNMYVNGLVQFDHNQNLIEGYVVLASEDRSFVEQEMQRLTLKAESSQMNGKLFFIQYSTTNRELVHKVVAETDIEWPVNAEQNPGEVFIKIGENQHKATVLLISEMENQIETEFEKLRSWCQLKGLDNSFTKKKSLCVGYVNWILVQYCKAPFEIVYKVLDEREAHWCEENIYKDVVVYINNGDTVYQALVLAKSRNLESLVVKINIIRDTAALSSLGQIEIYKTNNFKQPSVSSNYQQCLDKFLSA